MAKKAHVTDIKSLQQAALIKHVHAVKADQTGSNQLNPISQ